MDENAVLVADKQKMTYRQSLRDRAGCQHKLEQSSHSRLPYIERNVN
jgi:hypothetical protein